MGASFFNSLPVSLNPGHRVEQGGLYRYLACDGATAWSTCIARFLGAGLVDAIPIIGVGIAMYLIFVVAA